MKKAPPSKQEKEQKRTRVDRRTFLKLSALAGTAVGVHHVLGHAAVPSTQPGPRSIQKGIEEKWVATSCLNCPSRCGIRVRVVNGKAVRIAGNPLSHVSEGKVCPRAHIGLQVLYDPERINVPLKRTRKEKGKGIDPQWAPISWDQALGEITSRLTRLRESAQPQKLLVFYGLNSAAGEDMIVRFADAFGTPNVVSGDSLDAEPEKSGNWLADGHYAHTAYDLDQTQYLLAFGGDMLESCRPLSRFLRKWGRLRRERPNRAKVVVISPRYSVTAAKSDEWIPIRPGTEAALAMGIAHVIITDGLYDKDFVSRWTSGFDQYRDLVVAQYGPAAVSKITGIEAETIQRIGREFAQTQPAVAFRGRESINWPEGSAASYAIFCLNALVGNIDVPGGIIYQEDPKYRDLPSSIQDEIAKRGKAQPRVDLGGTDKFPAAHVVTNQVPESLMADSPYAVEMAIGFNSNFTMTAPGTGRWENALKKLPYYVHISPFPSEMASYADILLPSTTYLEEWGYDHSPAGSGFSEGRLKQPTVKPRGSAQSVVDIVFQISKRLPGSVAQSFSSFGNDSEGFARFRTETLAPWSQFVRDGVSPATGYTYRKYDQLFKTPSKKFEFCSGNLKSVLSRAGNGKEEISECLPQYKQVRFLGEPDKFPLILIPYQPLMALENGSQNYPWAQEIFLPMHGIGWETLVEMNSETARHLKLRDGQPVWVESPFHKIRARLKCSEGIHPVAIAMATGQGHWSYGKWQKGIGVNPNEIVGIDYDRISGQAAFFNTRVKVYKA
jgi:thiosulfate reductase / polysulfide reductase chain A